MADQSRQPIVVVCALQFECAQLRRAGLESAATLICCGPGAQGVERWALGEAAQHDDRPVILAGLAGGLVQRARVGEAFVISAVQSNDGRMLEPTWKFDERHAAPRATVSCPEHALTTPDAKRAWHAQHGTDLVDMESEAFAEAMMRQPQRRWAIVRGVSDGLDDSLPPEAESWVDAHGRTRSRAVALALLRNPRLVAISQRLGKRSAAAMAKVGEVVRSVVET